MRIGKFAQRMQEEMQRKNLKQADIAERTGIPTSAITMYYNGKYLPKAKNLKLIAQVLEVSESWLIDEEIGTNEELLLKMYRMLPKKKQKLLLDYCKKILTTST